MNYGTQKRPQPLANQNRKRHCIPRSLSPSMVKELENWKLYAPKGKKPRRWRRQRRRKGKSDRNRAKTRDNRRAFTQWGVPVLCRSLFVSTESWNVVCFCFKSNITLYCCLVYRVQMCAFKIVVTGSSSIQFSYSAASFVCKKRKSDEMRARERGRGKKTQMWGSMNKCPYWLIFCRISQGDCQVILSRWSRPTENHSESKLFKVPFRSLERNKRWEFRIYIHIQPIIENTPHSASWQPVCGENKRRNDIWYE